ncbi:MAG: type IV pilus assembly protein PilM [Minisyncoccia bacterium]
MPSPLESIKKIFGSKHKGPILGIDIGSSSIKVVLIEKVEERVVLRNYGEIALGPRADVAVGQATNLSTRKIVEALIDILKETGIVANHTLIAIPFSASLLSVVELPDIGKKELNSMVPIEARKYIPVPIAEVSLDWWVLPKRKSDQAHPPMDPADTSKQIGKIEVIIAAIHNEIIKKYETIKRNAQIPGESSHFEIEIFSTLRAVVGRDKASILVLDIGAGSTKLALVDAGVVRGSHVISAGGQDITIALSRSKEIPFDIAEEIKCRVGTIGDDKGRDVFMVADILLSNIMSEAARFVENYERKYNTKITKIILVGGGARLKGIEKIISKKFPTCAVSIGAPFERVETPAFLNATLKEVGPNFAVAIGVALKGLEE